ncbi:molybdate ABC transporter substrate-binding protein [Methylibium sp. Pch-M]|uniref:substrate-binding domain-containing protein n=1 Tax=Methylibium sp. Pch-M TaxID=2082386 RepID=UPI0010127652|nr:substrate-binding domain-containing protein [Methylibium sp. Pch-M]QAZ40904.1 molybdate ABC transporter substrate-binding protein [Methylibium sp. Pch-M]
MTGLAVFAAGSLRAPLSEIGRRAERRWPSLRLRLVFGASGLLRDRIAAGEAAQVFASANLGHPQALADAAGRGAVVRRFARNRLCVLARPEVDVTALNVLDRLLDPTVRVGTSTPGADPSGDYAWEFFRRIARRGGPLAAAYETLDRKALKLTGGPTSPPPEPGRSVYGSLLTSGQADVFVTYRSNARQAIQEVPGLQRIDLPADVDVTADYGVVLLDTDDSAAKNFVDLLLAPEGQAVLMEHGLAPR